MKVIIPVILGTIASILITLSALLPGWIIKKYVETGYISYVSLFYGIVCAESCKTVRFLDVFHFESKSNMFWVLEFEVEVILSIVMSAVGVITLYKGQRRYVSCKRLLMSTILFSVGGILIMMACGRIAFATAATNNHMQAEMTDHPKFHFEFPFALVPAMTGGALLLTSALMVCFIRKEVKEKRNSARIVVYDIWDTKDEPMPDFVSKQPYDRKSRVAT